jgi:hypothetical protein
LDIDMSITLPTPDEDLERFFDFFWADDDAWVYTPIARFSGTPNVQWQPLMFHWPRQRGAVIEHLLKNAATPDLNCYFSPVLFERASPKKDAVLGSRTLWCDYDGNAPVAWPHGEPGSSVFVPRPTMRVESSGPGREHVYWGLDQLVTDADWIDDKNRALAYATGADTSGWDANQVLRPPHTFNRKYTPARPVVVTYWDRD